MYGANVAQDQESLLMSPGYRISHSQLSSSLTSVITPSDSALELNHMYLEAKTNMLKIIEQGLQLKLDIQDIKDKFLTIMNDFDAREQKKMCPVPMPKNLPEILKRSSRKMSAVQARVWTFHQLRRARIQAKLTGSRRQEREYKQLEDQKENVLYKPVSDKSIEERLECSTALSLPVATQADRQLSTITWSIQTLLTPIREDYNEKFTNTDCLSNKSPILGSNSQSSYAVSTTKNNQNSPSFDTYGSASPNSSKQNGISECQVTARRGFPHGDCKPPTHKDWSHTGSGNLSVGVKQKQKISNNTRRRSQSTNDILECKHICSPFKRHSLSPVQTPFSEIVCDMNSNTSLRDISIISKTSERDPNEQTSRINISKEFNDTFNDPLHSTLDYPLHSTLTIDDTVIDTEGNHFSDTMITELDPTHIRGNQHIRGNHGNQQHHIGIFPFVQATDDKFWSIHHYNNDSSQNSSPVYQPAFSPRSYRTPSKKPQAQLCKEHGIHPTFDGSCIFQNGDTVTLNSSDDELDQDENGNTPKVTSNIRETDCDSSYLSECLDDHQSSIDVDQYEATYDSRKACIRMLKRQTGQVKLSDVKEPVGLSESDLYCDIMNKHFSLEAMRSSLPDISGLSTLPTSAAEDESSDMTLQASSTLKSHTGNIAQESDYLLSPNDTLVSNEQRPVSLSTNEESPESNTAMPVPVNSPNITDSGGSSSRQNTDNYDYMEMQPQQVHAGSDKVSLPGSHTTHSSQSCHSRKAQSLHSQHSHHSSKSYQPRHRSSPDQHHRHRRRYVSTPAELFDAESSRTTKSRTSYEFRNTKTRTATFPRPKATCCPSRHHQSYDFDTGCSTSHERRPISAHFTITDNMGRQRTIVQHSSVSQPLPKERKKALVKKLKHFSNSFYKGTSTGNLQIQTLGHF
ncbi:hypothetical protein LSH36_12g10032 [Paralvinella palmiformis]|uniref:Uncharacterized protein n=1 Tax=Paralvinella palmiformis TaxID=53620 RepID=A0AAD9KEM6_9ANNE|nr:hypothetical protein LSH36_12g10032 [Paralvinella palmiformis]